MSRRRLIPSVLLAVCALAAAAGCSTTDLAKVTYTRTTVPAGQNTGTTPPTSGKASDAPFSVDKLRLADPCELLDKDTLSKLGTPTEYTRSNFDECSNFMKDGSGKSLSVTVRVGESLTSSVLDKTDKQFGGIKGVEQKLNDNSACFEKVVVQEGPPAFGIGVQIGYNAGDPCEPGRTVAEAVIKRMKENPPLRTAEKGSLIAVDPCAVPDPAAVTEAVGGVGGSPYALHQCSWDKSGFHVTLRLGVGYDPKDSPIGDKPVPVDLGGTTAYQKASDSVYPTCELTWMHRLTGDNQGEIANVRFENINKAQLDSCAKAQAFAKAVLVKLPKA